MSPVKLNLGSGNSKIEGYISVDLDAENADVHCDLEDTWPFQDNSVDGVFAAHIFEHLKNPIHTMNELYRILKPGCKAEIHVPSTDGRGAFQDPTHTSFWNINSFDYYCSDRGGNWLLCKKYGFIGDFKAIQIEDYKIHQIVITKAVLEKR